jgi:hypothetical protein
MDMLQKDGRIFQSSAPGVGFLVGFLVQPSPDSSFEHQLILIFQPQINDCRRRNHRLPVALAQVTEITQLQFQLARAGHAGVRAIKRPQCMGRRNACSR